MNLISNFLSSPSFCVYISNFYIYVSVLCLGNFYLCMSIRVCLLSPLPPPLIGDVSIVIKTGKFKARANAFFAWLIFWKKYKFPTSCTYTSNTPWFDCQQLIRDKQFCRRCCCCCLCFCCCCCSTFSRILYQFKLHTKVLNLTLLWHTQICRWSSVWPDDCIIS